MPGAAPTVPNVGVGCYNSSADRHLAFPSRRVGRAVDCTGLENQQARKRFGGSNPSLSARYVFSCPPWVGHCVERSAPPKKEKPLRTTRLAPHAKAARGLVLVPE